MPRKLPCSRSGLYPGVSPRLAETVRRVRTPQRPLRRIWKWVKPESKCTRSSTRLPVATWLGSNTGSVKSNYNTMKCLDLYDSDELDKLTRDSAK
jgi:hypothetical protein